MNKKHCIGCYCDFYNQRGNCWHLKDAKLVTLFAIDTWTPQDRAENFRKVRKPNCFRGQGAGTHYYPRLPDHLRSIQQ